MKRISGLGERRPGRDRLFGIEAAIEQYHTQSLLPRRDLSQQKRPVGIGRADARLLIDRLPTQRQIDRIAPTNLPRRPRQRQMGIRQRIERPGEDREGRVSREACAAPPAPQV